MHPRVHYLRLLEEVNQRFDQPDWPTVLSWLQQEAELERARRDAFVPQQVRALEKASAPTLHPGDLVPGPILAPSDTYIVPARCQLAGSLHGLGTVELGEGVQVAQDVLAAEAIHWAGGQDSLVRNLMAPHIHITSPAGTVLGGLWCDHLTAEEEGADVAPGLIVRGMVAVEDPTDGLLVVGAGSQLGGLHVAGSVQTQRHVTVSYLLAEGTVQLGRNNRAGYVQAQRIIASTNCQIAAIVSASSVELAKGSAVDTIRAKGDILLDKGVHITGNLIRSDEGTFEVEPGEAWHANRAHWFYVHEQRLTPYQEQGNRPEGSALVALRALTHTLWSQMEQLAGRE